MRKLENVTTNRRFFLHQSRVNLSSIKSMQIVCPRSRVLLYIVTHHKKLGRDLLGIQYVVLIFGVLVKKLYIFNKDHLYSFLLAIVIMLECNPEHAAHV